MIPFYSCVEVIYKIYSYKSIPESFNKYIQARLLNINHIFLNVGIVIGMLYYVDSILIRPGLIFIIVNS